MAATRPTAHDMQRALYQHFCGRWAVLFEVSARPDPLPDEVRADYLAGRISRREMLDQVPGGRVRRIDVLLVRRAPKPSPTWPAAPAAPAPRPTPPPAAALFDLGTVPAPPPAVVEPGDGGGFDRLAIEVKVTRSDFFSDVANPDKQAPWRELAHRHAYAVPDGLVTRTEVPATSGLITVRFGPGDPRCRTVRPAPRAEPARPLALEHHLDMFYRASRAEALTRGLTSWVGGVRQDDADPEQLRAEVDRLTRELTNAKAATERARDRADRWRKRYGTCTPPSCGTCGALLRPVRGETGHSRWKRSGYGYEWDHLSQEEHDVCLELRTDRARAERGGEDRSLYVPAPEPAEPEPATQ